MDRTLIKKVVIANLIIQRDPLLVSVLPTSNSWAANLRELSGPIAQPKCNNETLPGMP
jgi:hypothetical protein